MYQEKLEYVDRKHDLIKQRVELGNIEVRRVLRQDILTEILTINFASVKLFKLFI